MMTANPLETGTARRDLANVIRAVNARHAEIGAPALPDLKQAWLSLDRSLSLATVAGDERAVLAAVRTYETQALAAIEEAS